MHPYWSRSDDRAAAWSLLFAIIALTFGLVFINVQYNYWNRNFFNALEQKNWSTFWLLIPYFFGLSALTVIGVALQGYLTQMLQMRWRVWITREYLGAWFRDRSFHHLELDPRGTDNPDQRMSEDLKQLTTSTLELSLGLLHNMVTLVSFVAILWSVSQGLSFALLGSTWNLPGEMVWAALLYAVLGTAATYYVGRPMIGLRFQQERLEADMRYSLMRSREHSEGIALYGGERAERFGIEDRIEGLRGNWRRIMTETLKLNSLASSYTQIGILLPYFLASPRYFTGQLTLGGLTQIAGAFDTVRVALSWFVTNYQALAIWKASIDRLLTFDAAVGSIAADGTQASRIVRSNHDAGELVIEDLVLELPTGRVLVSVDRLRIGPGERILLGGEPGAGKSTFFRAVAGLWRTGSGRILLPAEGARLFLPQKPYLPVGSVIAAASYPAVAETFGEDRVRAALSAVGLDTLAGELHASANWSQILSGGEQQKLAIARALLHRPEWLFLDEATSALDEMSEAAIYDLLTTRLATSTIVSIAHRPQLAVHHDRALMMVDGRLRDQGILGAGVGDGRPPRVRGSQVSPATRPNAGVDLGRLGAQTPVPKP